MSDQRSDVESNDSEFLKLDLSALQQAATQCLDKPCSSISKLGEGAYHKVYLLTMQDGSEFIGRVAFPNYSRLKTESEVATMLYLAEHTSIRVPKVYASNADPENAVGAEYLMEKIPGAVIGRKEWAGMPIEKKEAILLQVIDIMLQLFQLNFEKIGCIFGGENGTYRIGTFIESAFFFDERGAMDLDRGPWATAQEYLIAAIQREIDYLQLFQSNLAANSQLFPRDLKPDSTEIKKSFENLAHMTPYICPSDPLLQRIAFKHIDLRLGNIMIEGDCVTGVIDWECAGCYPAWSCAAYPAWIMEEEEEEDEEAKEDSGQEDPPSIGERTVAYLLSQSDDRTRSSFRESLRSRNTMPTVRKMGTLDLDMFQGELDLAEYSPLSLSTSDETKTGSNKLGRG
ncbi:kinase-like domain-containing protein [Endogone sp. FLAS-F59071]|nr:kinase-like domain-containing protein [Endogone sp. FLAS-F59071]|eukprot:RUS16575.1 kinase-like domain-containing protein [Endogone sp. FLAS-F59071]